MTEGPEKKRGRSEVEAAVERALGAFAQRLSQVMDADTSSKDLSTRIHVALRAILIASKTPLELGEVHALFGSLAKLGGVDPPMRTDLGTEKTLDDEFRFLGFTPRGTPTFRHRKTNRELYVVLDRNEFLLGLYDSNREEFMAFKRPADALSWVRGGDRGVCITNPLWDFLP